MPRKKKEPAPPDPNFPPPIEREYVTITDLAPYEAVKDMEVETSTSIPKLISLIHYTASPEDVKLGMTVIPALFDGKTLGQSAKDAGIALVDLHTLRQNKAFKRLVALASESRKDWLEAELYTRIAAGDNSLLVKALEQVDPSYRSNYTAPMMNAVKIEIKLDGEAMKIVTVENGDS